MLHVEPDASWPVARLGGEVDLSNVDDLGARLTQAVGNGATGLVLDLSDVVYLDSTGLRLLFGLARQLNDRQQHLRVVLPHGSLLTRLLDLSGFRQVAEVVDHLPDPPQRAQMEDTWPLDDSRSSSS